MYHARLTVQVKLGRFKEYLQIIEKMNDLARTRGWNPARSDAFPGPHVRDEEETRWIGSSVESAALGFQARR